MILVVPAQICLLFGTPSLTLVVITSLIKGLGWGFFGGLIYGMLADEIEYGHWRTGVRTEGMTFIASGIGTKIGIALGGGGVSIVMGMAGYDGTVAVQSASAQSMISNLFVYLPLITSLLVFVILLFYVIDKQYDSIMADLAEGRFYKSQAQQSILSAAVKINT